MNLQQLQIHSQETNACNYQPLGLGVLNQLKPTWKITQNLGAPEIKGVIRMVAWKTHLEAYETSQPGIKTYTISTDNYTLLLSETVIAVFEQTSP